MLQPGDITIFTSVVPGDLTRQREALQSWASAGFRLVSLNDPSEHAALQDAAADLPVTLRPVARSLRETLGRPLIRIDDILAEGRAEPCTHIGIINADIALRTPDDLITLLRDQPFDMLYGSRLDVQNADDASGTVYDGGYDLFVLSTDVAAAIPTSDFAIGRTYYDYFLPFCALVQGFRTVECRRPMIDHVRHPVRYDPSELLNTSVMMANVVLDMVRAAEAEMPPASAAGRPQPRAALSAMLGLYAATVRAAIADATERHGGDQRLQLQAIDRLLRLLQDGLGHFLRQGATVIG